MPTRDSPLRTSRSAVKEFLTGARDTVPLIVGAIPFGIIFGTVAVAGGLTLPETLGMSLFVFAGSAQFVALGLIAAGTGWPIIVLTTCVVNLRHALYSATLAPRVCRLPQRWQIPIAFFLTDETFAVVVKRFQTDAGDESDPGAKWYYLGSAVAMYANWQTCTFLGVTIGQAIPRAAEWGLDFAMPVTFIGMITPYLRSKPMIFAAVMAGTVSLATFTLPNKMGLIVAAAAGILAGVFSERRTLR